MDREAAAPGRRLGGYLLLVDTDGLRHAVRLGSVLAASDADPSQDMTLLQLPGARTLLLPQSLDQVLRWLAPTPCETSTS